MKLSITSLALALASCAAPASFSDVEVARFDAALDEMVLSQGAVGGLLIVGDARHRYAGARGLADHAAGRAMTTTTPFRSASVAKTFIGALILSLHEEGALSIDDPLSAHLDLVPDADAITLRMLLTHTSGIRNYTQVEAYREAASASTAPFSYEDLVAFAVDAGPEFPPGSAWSYSNTGYILLGMIAEAITGRPLLDELRARFFEPLGMHHTTAIDPHAPPADLARGYDVTADGPVDAVSRFGGHAFVADGGAFVTTLDDLLRWSRAFFAGDLHDPATLALARRPEGGALLDGVAQSFGLESGGYGAGFIVASDAAMGPLYAGAGNGDGVRTFVGYLPDADLGFALFVNVGDSQVPIVETLAAARPILGALREHTAP